MRVKRFSVAVWLLLSSAGFCLSLRVQAVALAESRIGFSNLQISPVQGTASTPDDLELGSLRGGEEQPGRVGSETRSTTFY